MGDGEDKSRTKNDANNKRTASESTQKEERALLHRSISHVGSFKDMVYKKNNEILCDSFESFVLSSCRLFGL